MASLPLERPAFFEGQYLGAEDLSALVRYVKAQNARQSLGHHSWGIVYGLELVELEAPDGTLEVHVLPGVAFDGYGRIIVVPLTVRIGTELLAGTSSGEFPVWIRYAERQRRGVRRGFEVCSTDDVFSRVAESFVLEIGVREGVSQRQDGVNLNGVSVPDAREARRSLDEAAPLVCDASIPAQALPDSEEDARWLVPLGLVSVQAGSPVLFLPRNAEQLGRHRRLRRYAGTIAESVYAPDGVIRLRDRYTPFDPALEVDEQCAARAIQAADLCDDGTHARELVWLEGHVRVVGDARLFGGALEFRNARGDDYVTRSVEGASIPASTPLAFRRKEPNDRGGADLQLLLGKSDPARPNRFSVAEAEASGTACSPEFSATDHVVFQDDGKVGVGAVDTELVSPLTVRGAGERDELLGFESSAKLRRFGLNLGADKTALNFYEAASGDASRLFLESGGRVGLGTETPAAALHVKGSDPSLFLDLDAGSPQELSELRFGSAGNVRSRLSWSRVTQKLYLENQGTTALVVQNGRIGLGTESPATTLHVNTGSDVSLSGHGYLVLGALSGLNLALDDNEVQARNDGAAATLHLQREGGNIAVGSGTASEKLHVFGNVRLGSTGELFAPGAAQNLRIVTGRVFASGAIAGGAGFTVSHATTGSYFITFNAAFGGVPVVVATLCESEGDNDEVVSVHSLGSAGFRVELRDVHLSGSPLLVDQGFCFIAMGIR